MEKQPLPSGVEERARDLLKLGDLESAPHALPLRNDWLWRAEGFAPRVPYTSSFLLPLGNKPDLGPVRDALAALVTRHEALKSKLVVENDIPVMVPAPGAEELTCVSIASTEIATQREGRPAPTLAAFLGTPIELYQQSGLRCRAFMDEDGQVHLAVLMHHYYGDAWSSQIVRREFTALHAARLGQSSVPLPPVAQYSDYGLFQRRALDKSLTRQLGYWHRTLRDMPPARLPYDTEDESPMLGRAFFLVEEDVMRRLDALAKTQRVSLGLVCYSALQIALARWCGQEKMVSGLVAANRIRPQFQGTVGSLLSIIPVSSALSDISFRAFLMGFARTVFDGIANQDVSIDNYNEIFQPSEPLGVPRFNFVPRQENFFVGADETPRIAGIQPASDIKRNSAYTDLHILMLEYPKGILGRMNFAHRLSLDAIKTLILSYQDILGRVAADPDTGLAALG